MTSTPPRHILRIDSSMRHDGSHSRRLTDQVVDHLTAARPGTQVTVRDLAGSPARFVDETWIGANFTAPEDRTDTQKAALAHSEELIGELRAADTIVIGVPIYNFNIPAALKAWIDLVARARETFRYSEAGPVGLLEGKRAILVFTSGGTAEGSEMDFATPYLRFILSFIGIDDVEVIDAGRLMFEETERLDAARARIEALVAA